MARYVAIAATVVQSLLAFDQQVGETGLKQALQAGTSVAARHLGLTGKLSGNDSE